MEGLRVISQKPFQTSFQILVLFVLLSSCSSKFLKYEHEDKLKNNEEFDAVVKITTPIEKSSAPEVKPKEIEKPVPVVKVKGPKKNRKSKVVEPLGSARREPEIEDTEGFDGRRPLQDPFHVGESVIHHVKYFKVHAGTIAFKIDPFVEVNGRKSYSFVSEVKSANMFNSFYSVDDRILTLMDYDQLIPRVFTMHVKETGQLREARSLFDFDKLKATYWEKKVTEKNGAEEKKQQWDILPFSQNVFSALFYMRVFKWDLGKIYSFRVSDDESNIVFRGTALRKEVLSTSAGEFKAIVIKPEFTVKGVFKPVGDIFIWLSDDDRKLVLRIECKIKIGTLVSEIESYTPGN